jgi:hypothetical protein
MLIARTAQGRPILFEHGGEHLQARCHGELHQLRPRIHEQVNERKMALGRQIDLVGPIDYARLSLHGGSLLSGSRPGLVTTRVPRAVRSRCSQISTAIGTSPSSSLMRATRDRTSSAEGLICFVSRSSRAITPLAARGESRTPSLLCLGPALDVTRCTVPRSRWGALACCRRLAPCPSSRLIRVPRVPPTTSTDKIDYEQLKQRSSAVAV